MEKIIQVYNRLISEFIIEKVKYKENAILFFQGFPSIFYKALQESELKHFCGTVLNDSGYIDFRTINSGDLLQKFLGSTSLCWGYYEELLGLTEILNDLTLYKGEIIVVRNNLYSIYYPIDVPVDMNEASRIYENDSSNIDNERIAKFYSDFKVVDGIGFYSYINKHYDIDTNAKIAEVEFFYKKTDAIKVSEGLIEKTIHIQDLQSLKNDLLCGKLSSCIYVIQCLNEQLADEVATLNLIGSSINVYYRLDNISRTLKTAEQQKHLQLFREYWGNDANFFEHCFYKDPALDTETVNISQGVLISDIIDQSEDAIKGNNYSDVIITAPTGAGKSLFFQIPAIYLHEKYKALTVVICPLIALMHDQVKEIQERGIGFATYINSEISYEEKQDRLEGINKGRYSIVYLSPELLLSYDIKSIIGDRKIGLMVIDEAHLVTSWGRDFRVDYWFLGDYFEKVRRGRYYRRSTAAMNFPVLCLTATAVYRGRDDVIEDLQRSLHLNCSSEHLYIGYVRRDNIRFEINRPQIRQSNSKKEEKLLLTMERTKDFLSKRQKSIVYFPFVSQTQDVYNQISEEFPKLKKFVEKYSGSGMKSFEKNDSYNRFRDSESLVMLATKAFGMGINIPDVRNIYHYAPTGTLADYVQEIGRAARKLDYGSAIIDYLPNDMHYAKTLWGLSGLRHYQIKAIMKKLYDLYQIKRSRNLLFSPDVFSYLFDANSVDMKVKSGLMLLSSDLLEKYHFRVIIVRPKNIFKNHYINVPLKIEQVFLREYGKYCEEMHDDKPRVTPAHGWKTELKTYNSGKTYEIDLGKVWENEFNEHTFAKFKYHFFTGDLFLFESDKVIPRIKLVIHYEKSYETAKDELQKIGFAMQKAFNYIHRKYGGKDFIFDEFRNAFNENYDKKVRKEYLIMLLDLFCYEKADIYDIPNEQWKFIEKRKYSDSGQFGENKYCIRTSKHNFIEQNIKRYLVQSSPNSDDGKEFVVYLPIPKKSEKYSEYQLVASLLEMFDLATYDLIGGRNPQIFVRINDPLKLKRIAESEKEYRNSLLTNIEERHKRAAMIVDKFMTSELSDEERWSVIVNYFLGYDGLVDSQLGIDN
ncbi:MAG: DEAD/DEAH box helicase [Candidatus Desantisbacteria bacterium]